MHPAWEDAAAIVRYLDLMQAQADGGPQVTTWKPGEGKPLTLD